MNINGLRTNVATNENRRATGHFKVKGSAQPERRFQANSDPLKRRHDDSRSMGVKGRRLVRITHYRS
jgi:hypothetical protein